MNDTDGAPSSGRSRPGLVARVRRTIEQRRLIEPGQLVLVACSGGPDSGALVAALARLSPSLGLRLHVASVDHGLRPDAGRDVAVAQQQATSLQVPFTPLAVTVGAGPSVQAQARAARYTALAELAQTLGAARIATGHTADDQAETVVMRMLRGAGMRGLCGVSPQRGDGVVRPLIDCRRAEVAAFARAHLPAVADDPTNRDGRFERVRVRREVMPLLEREDAGVVGHLGQLRDEAEELLVWLDRRAAACLEKLGSGRRLTPSAEDRDAPWCVQLLRLWVEREAGVQLGRAHLQQLRAALTASAEVWLPGGHRVLSRGDGTLALVTSPD